MSIITHKATENDQDISDLMNEVLEIKKEPKPNVVKVYPNSVRSIKPPPHECGRKGSTIDVKAIFNEHKKKTGSPKKKLEEKDLFNAKYHFLPGSIVQEVEGERRKVKNLYDDCCGVDDSVMLETKKCDESVNPGLNETVLELDECSTYAVSGTETEPFVIKKVKEINRKRLAYLSDTIRTTNCQATKNINEDVIARAKRLEIGEASRNEAETSSSL